MYIYKKRFPVKKTTCNWVQIWGKIETTLGEITVFVFFFKLNKPVSRPASQNGRWPDNSMNGQWSTRRSTGASVTNCQLDASEPRQHLPSPSLIGLEICMTQHLFFQPTERRRGRDGWRKKGRTLTKIEFESKEKRDGRTDGKGMERMKRRDKETSVERQRAFFSVNWRAR